MLLQPRKITISGSFSAVELARKMLTDVIAGNAPHGGPLLPPGAPTTHIDCPREMFGKVGMGSEESRPCSSPPAHPFP